MPPVMKTGGKGDLWEVYAAAMAGAGRCIVTCAAERRAAGACKTGGDTI